MSCEVLALDEVQIRKTEASKEFCRKRNLKVTGTKAELVAQEFAASEMGIEVQPTYKERIPHTEKEKVNLLVICMPEGVSVPDPLTLR